MADTKLVDIEVILVYETEKAVLVRNLDRDVQAWVPKSGCELTEKDRRTGRRTLTLSESLAIDKRLV